MRTLEFWKEKLNKAQEQVPHARVDVKYFRQAYKLNNQPLRNQYGCRLTERYTGFKKQARRKHWLDTRRKYTQKIAKAEHTVKKLDARIAYYQSMIDKLSIQNGT